MKTDERLGRYEQALRWGNYETAADFQPAHKKNQLDLDFLKSIRVTTYSPVYRVEQEGSDILQQTVEIRYYQEQTGLERTLTDRQTWRYDQEKDQWFLESGLPNFK